jgi:hypothetical protein
MSLGQEHRIKARLFCTFGVPAVSASRRVVN